MALTRTVTVRLLRTASIILLIAVIIAYAIWRSLNYAKGPRIEIFQPHDGASTASSTVTIVGRADRVINLLLNGRAVSVDQQGNFSETIIIFPGENMINLTAKDQFGRSTEKELTLVGTP